jgi:hypothetical protein
MDIDGPLVNINGYLENDILPIPITEKLLEAYGFLRPAINPKLLYLPVPQIKAEIHFEIHKYGSVFVLQSDFGQFIPNDIKHLHQLQNLFYYLCGEELIINEEKLKESL